MELSELEDALDEILPPGFHVSIDKKGQVVIFTGLTKDEDGELVSMDDDDEDPDFDPDFEPLTDEEEEDD